MRVMVPHFRYKHEFEKHCQKTKSQANRREDSSIRTVGGRDSSHMEEHILCKHLPSIFLSISSCGIAIDHANINRSSPWDTNQLGKLGLQF